MKLWESDKSFQKNAGDAITRCLVALETTGVDSDTQELSTLWVESFDDDNEFDADFDDGSVAYSDIQSTGNSIAKFDPPLEEWVITQFRSEREYPFYLSKLFPLGDILELVLHLFTPSTPQTF